MWIPEEMTTKKKFCTCPGSFVCFFIHWLLNHIYVPFLRTFSHTDLSPNLTHWQFLQHRTRCQWHVLNLQRVETPWRIFIFYFFRERHCFFGPQFVWFNSLNKWNSPLICFFLFFSFWFLPKPSFELLMPKKS